MLDIGLVINSLKQNGYYIKDTSINNVTCAISPSYRNEICPVIVICDNRDNLIVSNKNLEEIRKIICEDPLMPDKQDSRYLYVVINGWEEKRLKANNVVLIEKNKYYCVHGKVSPELKKESELIRSIVASYAAKYEKYCDRVNMYIPEYHKVWLTYILIAASMIGFLITGSYKDALGISANSVITQKQYYRVFAYLFVHGNILHLITNMVSLYFIGKILEKRIGWAKMLAIYFITAIYGAIVSILFSTMPDRITVGASGAICGLLTALLVTEIKYQHTYYNYWSNIPTILGCIGVTLFTGVLRSSVDNWCHIGGMIGGILFMLLFIACDELEKSTRKISYIRKAEINL